jgi:hypothetical protein
MQILDRAVAVLRSGKGRADGAKVAAKLEALAVLGEKSVKIWQGYLDQPGATGDKYTLVSWMGADRARQLYELSLEAGELVKDVCAAAGDAARFLVLDESPIVQAYGQLKDGETGPQAAQARLAAQQAMVKHLHGLAGQARSAKPATGKKPAAKAAGKPAKAKKRPAAKKKPAAKRKPAARKPAAKKAAKKPTVKKAAKKK